MYLNVSLNLTQLVEAYKAGHTSCTRHQNGNVYVNTTIWINPDADQDWKQVSVQLNSAKDKDAQDDPIVKKIAGEKAKKIYPGNGRIGKKKDPEAVAPGSTDLDLGGSGAPAAGGFVPPQQDGDLPF